AYAEVIPIVLQHHEWFDGTGYPDGLAGEAISLGGRIFAVADVYDALTSDRPYRAGLDPEHAIESIKQGTGRQFDPRVVEAFLEVMAEEGTGSPSQSAQSRSFIAS
ncbi:MAG: HD domain-containing protein, partial [candidate division NC10 bacterium]|nr:HD domain-containing protein [candidate division NC10 bacterium]